MDPEVFQKVLAAAPEGVKRADETLAKTEKAIRDLNLRLEWTDRALKNLPAKEGTTPGMEEGAVGFGYSLSSDNSANVQLLRHGQKETIPLEKNEFLPGDEIVTDSYGKTKLKTLGAGNVLVTVGPSTRMKLETDGRAGTTWNLRQGTVHCAPFLEDLAGGNSLIVTSEAVVQGEEGSEYDVRISEKGQTFVEVYRGKVEVKEPKKGTSYFVEPGAGTSKQPRWWEEK